MKVIEIQDLTTYQQTEKRGDPNPKSRKKNLWSILKKQSQTYSVTFNSTKYDIDQLQLHHYGSEQGSLSYINQHTKLMS
jgi:hypothetical protein